MTIELCKTDRQLGTSTIYPICTADVFREYWRPAAEELGLEMVECLPCLTITADFKDRFTWVRANASVDHRRSMLESVDQLINVTRNTSLDQFELSTG